MGISTSIEWADSSLNIMMGCDGCELWNPKSGVKHCYAGTLTDRYGGRKGYPKSFAEPALFLDRLDTALKWSDLTGKERPEKPWLNGLPRMIFLNDMGDTFTESLPLDWLAPLLPRMADSPHVWMLLTKRGARMQKFSEAHPLPENVWPGVSITTQGTMKRVDSLMSVRGGGVKWISAEPLLGPVQLSTSVPEFNRDAFPCDALDIDLVIVGGESGPGARPCDISWIRSIVEQCKAASVSCFVKQLGSNIENNGIPWPNAAWAAGVSGMKSKFRLNDSKGGAPEEWPADIRVRQFHEPAKAGA